MAYNQLQKLRDNINAIKIALDYRDGIMPQAVKLIVGYAFTHLDVIRIQAGILGNNPKSMRVLEKAGFTKEGILKNGIIKNGVVLDEHIYAVLRDEIKTAQISA